MEYDKFQLKDGCTVVFDELKEQDLPRLIEVFNSVIAEGATFIEMKVFQTLKQPGNGIKTTLKLDSSILPQV